MYKTYQRHFSKPRRNFGRRGAPPMPSVSSYVRRATGQIETTAPVARPTMAISELKISDQLKQNITNRGYTTLMPIQEQVIPAVLADKDIIGIANTGTGKTAAFLIPIIEKIIHKQSFQVLIITPTRELAFQIREELQKFSQRLTIYSALLVGQSSAYNQIADLRRMPQVIIGTPGRLNDFIERRHVRLESFNMVVLDEVDQMLNMGFLPDVRRIIAKLPKERQSLFFSATVSGEINGLINSFVHNPVTISVKTTETTKHIKQEIVNVVPGKTKLETLIGLLTNEELKKVLIFGKTKHGVERLSQDLIRNGIKAISIHGDKPQFKRYQAMRMFKDNTIKIMVATDVAARGLDIADVTHVINYDAPATYEDYIHRIGRTGRANKQGVALSFAGM